MRFSARISALLLAAAAVASSTVTTASAFVVVVPANEFGVIRRWSFTTQQQMARRPGGGSFRGADVVDKPTMNEEIKQNQLRVVTPNPKGKDDSLGIMTREEALAKAKELGGLDLILVNDKSDPPVCKIVDYSKYRYMQEKKAKEVKKNSKATEIKEVKMSYKIDDHDYEVRQKSALKFLSQGNRVKCTVMFRGREVQHDKLGFDLLEKLAQDLEDLATTEGRPKREGRNLSFILSPRAEVLKAVNDKRRAQEKDKKKKKSAEAEARAASKASSAAVADVAAEEGVNGDKSIDDIIDMESSLDELLGGSDDFSDDIFS